MFKFSGYKISILVTLFVTMLFLWNYLNFGGESFLELIDKKIIDVIVKTKAETFNIENSEIVIAAIDTKAVDKYGRWPWGRDLMAKLLHELETHYEVGIVGYDAVFSEPDPNDVTAEKVIKEFYARAVKKSPKQIRQLSKIKRDLESELKNDANLEQN